ncbi:uncharacterized protein N7503_002387 [Penicillium pulvis]|uniref:uncharacterized protein n=1 Tax=Penicillium pulvis TaxID=1562058 RepID=UPI00254768C6|nr:uncharacterized protein N7503_002387 [Penicillium pulvis]KAJ5810169.1 hypothetical protein N7503_002387 [Penicillium pulvis]
MSSTSVTSSEPKDEKPFHSTWSGKPNVQGTPPSPSSASSTSLTSRRAKKSVIEYIRLLSLVIGICLGVIIGSLDMNIVSTALPSITDQFHSSQDDGWYGTAYLMTLSAVQLFWGHLYKAFPAKVVFLSALGIFEVGCTVSATASSSTAVIFGRAVSGLGSAGFFCGCLIIMSYVVALRFRPMVNALIGLLIGSTQAMAPVVAGALTSGPGWRWCFWISLPIGAIASILVILGCSIQEPADRLNGKTLGKHWVSFDWVGLGLWIPFIACFMLILQCGGSQYGWTSGSMVALYVMTPILLGSYVIWQWHAGEDALTPARIMSQRSMVAGSLYMLFNAAVESQIPYFSILVNQLPVFFQAVQEKTALQAGTDTLPYLMSLVAFFIIAGTGTTIVGYYFPFMILGSTVLSIGTGLLSTFTVSTPLGRWVGYQVIAGAGLALGFDAPQLAAQTVFNTAEHDMTIALTIITSLMNLGGALGVSTGTLILNNRATTLLVGHVPGLTSSIISKSGLTDILSLVPAKYSSSVSAAYAQSIQSVFYSTTAFALLTFMIAWFMEWKSVKDDHAAISGDEEKGKGN